MKDSLNVLPLLLVGTGVILFSFSDVVFKILTSLDILWWDFLVFGVPFEILLILIITGIRKDFNKRKVVLSIKLLEEIEKKEALEKYGSEGSGKNLPFSSLSEDLKKKKEDKE